MKPDKNYISIHGDNTGNIYMGDKQLFAAGDYSKPREVLLDQIIPPDDTYADALKLSGVVDLTVYADYVVGGREDVVDINRCKNVTVVLSEVIVMGRYLATIKGGSTNIVVHVHDAVGRGTETDFDIGNWSDQSMARTTHVFLWYGKSSHVMRCRVLHGWVPALDGGPWVVNKSFKGWFGFAYGMLKKVLRMGGGGK